MTTRKISRLPSLPTIAVEILRVFSDPDAPIQKVADLVMADPAIAGKLLKAANSNRFGLKREVADLRQAITLMGKAKVTPIVLSFSLASQSVESPEHAEHFKRFWLRSFVQATAGEVLATTYGPGFAAESFTVNLLAGIGQLGLLKQDVDQYMECVKRSEGGETCIADIETEVYGATSRELTIEMMQQANLPSRCTDAIALIGDSKTQVEDQEIMRLGQIASVADAFARYMCDSDTGLALIVLKDRLSLLESQSMDLDSLTQEVKSRIDESAALFDIDPDELPDSEDLLEDAMEQLADFTHRMQERRSVPNELLAENGRLQDQVHELVKQTSTDALTGIANRAFFDRRLSEMTLQTLRRRCAMGVAVVDIDHFKRVNDTYGHLAGDYILQEVAQNLERVTRTNETLARYGGEEFAVLLEDVTADGMNIFGERLRSTVEELRIEFDGTMIPVTISIGIACDQATDDAFGKELFARADAALYQSKQDGRNRVTIDYRVDAPVADESAPDNAAGCPATAAV